MLSPVDYNQAWIPYTSPRAVHALARPPKRCRASRCSGSHPDADNCALIILTDLLFSSATKAIERC